jgi:hypothetical protein
LRRLQQLVTNPSFSGYPVAQGFAKTRADTEHQRPPHHYGGIMINPTGLKKLATLVLLAVAPAVATLTAAGVAHADPPVNLRVDNTVRAELLAAGAQIHGVPASEYTGLVPGKTYYGYDPATVTYWAGAQLMPSPTSERAQVSVQDAGSYTLFRKIKGGLWTAFNDGAGRERGGCPQDVPAAVLAMWNWDPQQCRP